MWQTKFFRTQEEMARWVSRKSKRYVIEEIMVDGGYGVDFKKKTLIFAVVKGVRRCKKLRVKN